MQRGKMKKLTLKQNEVEALSLSKTEIKKLAGVFDDDLDLVLFFVKWIEHGQNATKAYQDIHPEVSYGSARVLGSRVLAKVDIQAVLETYGIGLEKYLKQLADGLGATKWNDFTGEREADHVTRRYYHDKQGKLLGIEKTGGDVKIGQVGGEMSIKFIADERSTERVATKSSKRQTPV